jgi:hypothetical protein
MNPREIGYDVNGVHPAQYGVSWRDESSVPITGKELFDQLSDYSVLKKDFTSYTKLTGKLWAYER